MRGRHTLSIISKRFEYNLTFNRNITIIRGDSGTGKTILCGLLAEYKREGENCAFKVRCSCKLSLLSDDWEVAEVQLQKTKDALLFVDEDANYLDSLAFVSAMMKSSCYFVIISRLSLKSIPFCYKEVYELNSVVVCNTTLITNQRFYKDLTAPVGVDCIITEDTKSGFTMLHALCGDNVVGLTKEEIKFGVGNNKLLSKCQALTAKGHKVFVLADGAAIGYLIEGLYREALTERNIYLWLPESFEYLLLASGIVWRRDVIEILKDPAKQIESELFHTWEQFFTWLVTDIMSVYSGHSYVKGNLRPWYYNSTNVDKLERIVPEELKHLIDKHPSVEEA